MNHRYMFCIVCGKIYNVSLLKATPEDKYKCGSCSHKEKRLADAPTSDKPI